MNLPYQTALMMAKLGKISKQLMKIDQETRTKLKFSKFPEDDTLLLTLMLRELGLDLYATYPTLGIVVAFVIYDPSSDQATTFEQNFDIDQQAQTFTINPNSAAQQLVPLFLEGKILEQE